MSEPMMAAENMVVPTMDCQWITVISLPLRTHGWVNDGLPLGCLNGFRLQIA